MLKIRMFCHRAGEKGGVTQFRPVWVVLIMYYIEILFSESWSLSN